MLNNNYFNYFPTNSRIHRINPTVKIIIFLFSILNMFINDEKNMVIFLIIVFIMIAISRIPLTHYLKMVYVSRYLFLIIILICAPLGISIKDCLLIIVRVATTIEVLSILIFTTTPIEIADGIDNIIRPFNILFIKTGKLTLSIMLTIKFLSVMLSETDKVLTSQASRGFDYFYKTIIGKLIVIIKSSKTIIKHSKLSINKIKINMEQKLYNANKIRTKFIEKKVGYLDMAIIVTTTINFIMYLLRSLWNI